MIETKTFEVTGMKCGHCAQQIEGALRVSRGIKSVKANHEAGTVEVQYDEATITPDSIMKIVAVSYTHLISSIRVVNSILNKR